MAEPSELEQLAQAAPQGQDSMPKQQVEKKKETPLEEIVNFIGNTAKIGLAGVVPYTQGLLFPSVARDTAMLAASQIAGDATTDRRRDKKYTAGNTLESAIIGTVLAPPLVGLFEAVHKIPLTSTLGYLGQAAAWGGIAYPAYFALYQFVNYTVRNKTIKGVGKYIKENYWTALKHAWKTLYPLSVINLLFAPTYLNIPIAATLSYLLTLFGAPKTDEVKEDQKRDKTPYLVSAINVTAKLVKNVLYQPFKALYDVGQALGGVSGSGAPASPAPSRAAPAAPQIQPAH